VLELERYLQELTLQGRLLAQSARQATLLASVESCPGWTIARLLGHTSKAHHWALAILRGADPGGFEFSPPSGDELFEVYEAGLAALLSQLRTSPAGLQVWTLAPAESATLFWARRQAHETAIHRVDAQLAAGFGVEDFEPDFAADGIDELFTVFAAGGFDPAGFSEGLPAGCRISLTPLDCNSSWTLSVAPDWVSCVPGSVDNADLSVFATVSDLYRWVWNRAGDAEVALRGDLRLADRWRQSFRVGARRN
jgi:uncharacterized protein (TIGR03083 family)